jgi:predicted ribosomally synthesized peptide with SipW-like signal peptide
MAKRTNLRLMAVAVMVVLIGTGSAWAEWTEQTKLNPSHRCGEVR